MATGYTRQSSGLIVSGAGIQASHFNDEFNQLESAFSASTGHNHDGTAGGGALIDLTSSVTGDLPVADGGTGSSTAAGARTNLGLAIGTDIQGYDAGLNSIAGLTTAADKMIYTTALDTYAVTDLTSFGRTLLANTNASEARSDLGVVIGTDVQAYDASLTSLAALATTADRVMYTTAANTYAEATLTSFARSLLDDASQSAAQATLGLTPGTNVQAYDAGLASIAGLTTAADTMIYTSSLDTYNTTSLTSFGRTLIANASAADARSDLGLIIGTNVQAYDAGLASIAGLTTAADKMIYATASDVYATTDVTAFARSLLDDADAATARATLGITDTTPVGTVRQTIKSTADTGWLMYNGSTIGSAGSGATYASADYQTLYEMLWNEISDTYAPVAGGRGASATADFNANKALTMPDPSGRAPIGAGTGSGLTARTNGSSGGEEDTTLVEANLPAHSHGAGTLAADSAGDHTHTVRYASATGGGANALYNVTNPTTTGSGTHTSSTNGAHTHTMSGSTASAGSDTAHNNMMPWMAFHYQIKY